MAMITHRAGRTLGGAALILGLSLASLGGTAAAQSQFYASPNPVTKDANGYAVFSVVAKLGVSGAAVVASHSLYRSCTSSSLGPNGETIWLSSGGSSLYVSAQDCADGTYGLTLQHESTTYRTTITIHG